MLKRGHLQFLNRIIFIRNCSTSGSGSRSGSTKPRPFPILDSGDFKNLETCPDFSPAVAKSSQVHDELRQLRIRCQEGGGEKAIDRHVRKNKKVLVRQRIDAILDPNPEPGNEPLELSVTAGMGMAYGDVPCAGTVSVIGSINGVRCVIIANDATVKGGTSYPITVTKSLRSQEIAFRNGLPCVYIVDSGGAFLPLQSEIFPDSKHGGRSFANQAIMSSCGIPQMSLVAGMCTAGGAYTPTMADEHIMVHKIANVYLGGPPLVKAALGEVISGEKLGGATVHCSESGVADHFCETEEDAFRVMRDAVASLNLSGNTCEFGDVEEPLFNISDLDYFAGLDGALNRDQFQGILCRILDGSRFQEFKSKFGENLVTGFGFLNGRQVGIVANIDVDVGKKECQKGSHFIQICDSRDVPIIFFQNSGFGGDSDPDPDYDKLKERSKMCKILANARVPKITLNLSGVSREDESFFMCGPGFDPRFYFCWPRSFIGTKSALWLASNLISDGAILPAETRKILSQVVEISMQNHVSNRDLIKFKMAAGVGLNNHYGPIRI